MSIRNAKQALVFELWNGHFLMLACQHDPKSQKNTAHLSQLWWSSVLFQKICFKSVYSEVNFKKKYFFFNAEKRRTMSPPTVWARWVFTQDCSDQQKDCQSSKEESLFRVGMITEPLLLCCCVGSILNICWAHLTCCSLVFSWFSSLADSVSACRLSLCCPWFEFSAKLQKNNC